MKRITAPLTLFFTMLTAVLVAQTENYHGMKSHLDASCVTLNGNKLKVKLDERFTDYTLTTGDIKIYQSADNPQSGMVSSFTNHSSSGSKIKRGINMLEITLGTSHASGYYVLEMSDSRGNASYLRFYHYTGLSGSGPGSGSSGI